MWTSHFFKKMASGRKGSGVQLIQRLWETDSKKSDNILASFYQESREAERNVSE